MATIFSKIIAREIPGHFVYEDDICVAILDKFPAVPGQTLVIPKIEVDYAFDLDDRTYAHLFAVAKRIAHALDAVYDTERTCLIVEGFEVPHAHLKLYPIQKDTRSLKAAFAPGSEASDGELAAAGARIRAALEESSNA